MITSPCKTCVNLYKPKDVCSKDCEKLKKIQNLQLSRGDGPYMGVDCADSGRYALRLPISNLAQV